MVIYRCYMIRALDKTVLVENTGTEMGRRVPNDIALLPILCYKYMRRNGITMRNTVELVPDQPYQMGGVDNCYCS
jgi:hypothetical protein